MKTPTRYTNGFKRMRALLDKPESWTKYASARVSPGGAVVNSRHPLATCFCLMGAATVTNPTNWRFRNELTSALLEMSKVMLPKRCQPSVIHFNDRRQTTHQDVLEFLDIAILNCELAGV